MLLKIKSLEWCIQERDKTIKDMREDNLRMYKKIEFSKEDIEKLFKRRL